MNGYISGINITSGQYVDPQSAIAEIMDISKLQLRLAVYEKDNYLLKKVKINVGRLNKGYAENLNTKESGKIVTKSAYSREIE